MLFAKPASQELEAAIRWYEQRREGLGAGLYDATVARTTCMSSQSHTQVDGLDTGRSVNKGSG